MYLNDSEFQGMFEKAVKELNLEHYFNRIKTPKDNNAFILYIILYSNLTKRKRRLKFFIRKIRI